MNRPRITITTKNIDTVTYIFKIIYGYGYRPYVKYGFVYNKYGKYYNVWIETPPFLVVPLKSAIEFWLEECNK